MPINYHRKISRRKDKILHYQHAVHNFLIVYTEDGLTLSTCRFIHIINNGRIDSDHVFEEEPK